MFDKLCIKSKELGDQKIDIGFLCEALIFYEKVVLLAYKEEIILLLKFFGERRLEKLIDEGRLELLVREDILGTMMFPVGKDEKYNIDVFSKKGETYSSILYEAHRELVKNSTQNTAFAKKFSKLTKPFRYGKEVTEQIRADFNDVEYLKLILPIYFNSVVKDANLPEEIEVAITKDSSFGRFEAYSMESNIDLKGLNQKLKEQEPHTTYEIGYSGFILSIAESRGDIFIASTLEGELVTSDLYSKFIQQKIDEIISKHTKSKEQLSSFEEYIFEYNSIREAFNNNGAGSKELIDILDNSNKFKIWLKDVPKNKDLVKEYYKAITAKTWADKLPAKTTRFMLFTGIGLALDAAGTGGLGTLLSTVLSGTDSFYLDKILKGWKPNQFIDDQILPIIKK